MIYTAGSNPAGSDDIQSHIRQRKKKIIPGDVISLIRIMNCGNGIVIYITEVMFPVSAGSIFPEFGY
jgi:hypothetical protein